METNPNNEERIAGLIAELQSAKNESQKYKQDLEKLRQQYADDLFEERRIGKRLVEERHQIQHDYNQLRVQKGGFGIKMLTLSGFAGFLSGLLMMGLYFYFFKHKSQDALVFEQFRDQQMFNYERAISQGDFESVEASLQQNLELPENKIIRPEIEFVKKIVGAAKRRCE